eukprot:UN30645
MDDCDILIYSDADIFLIGEGFEGILEECDPAYDVCMTSQSRNLCVGLDCCEYSPILVANSGVMVINNAEKLIKVLKETLDSDGVFRRDQHLFGHILCDTDKLNFEILPDGYNALFNYGSIEDVRAIHYTAGPDLLSPRTVDLKHIAYNVHDYYSAYRNNSLAVDVCYAQRDGCENVDEFECVTKLETCVRKDLAAMAPVKREGKALKGFDWMVCTIE